MESAPAAYLALGDSYTICTGASSPAQRWPNLVAGRLARQWQREVTVTNLAVNACSSSELIDTQLPHIADRTWDFISVLIGVNDFFRGYDERQYRARIAQIYDAVAAVSGARVLTVSIPDYSYTPVGASSGDPQAIVAGLRLFNATARGAAQARGFTWVDIFDVSRSRIGTPGWIAGDNLHPGDAQYEVWAEHIWSVVGLMCPRDG